MGLCDKIVKGRLSVNWGFAFDKCTRSGKVKCNQKKKKKKL